MREARGKCMLGLFVSLIHRKKKENRDHCKETNQSTQDVQIDRGYIRATQGVNKRFLIRTKTKQYAFFIWTRDTHRILPRLF